MSTKKRDVKETRERGGLKEKRTTRQNTRLRNKTSTKERNVRNYLNVSQSQTYPTTRDESKSEEKR